MARGVASTTSVSRPGSMTTYKAKKRSPGARTIASDYKSSNVRAVSKLTTRKATLKAVEDDPEGSDKDDDNDGTDSSEEASDPGNEDDEFDPQLKAMVAQSGLRFQRGTLPYASTPNTSRTLVNRSKHHLAPVAAPTPKLPVKDKNRKAVAVETDSDDDVGNQEQLSDDSSSSSNDDEDSDEPMEVAEANQRQNKNFKTTAALASKRGKENAPMVGKGGVPKANDPSRRFGQEIQPRLGRSSVSRNSNQNRDRGATTSHHTTSRILRAEHSRPEATSYHQQVANLLRDQMSDSDRTDSTGDRNAFGFQTALVQTVPAKAHHHAEKYDVVGPVGSDGEEGESDGEVVEQALKEYGQAREEIKLDVKEIKAAFRGIGASMKAQQSKVSKQLTEEIQPMQHTTAKLYKTMAGQYTEKMLDQQSLLHKSLTEHRQIFGGAKKELTEREGTLRKKMLDLQEDAIKLRERKKKVLDRALKQIVELNKKQAKEERAIVAEMEQLRDRAKAKAEKLLDPAVLNAKFAKQRKYIYEEVGI